VNDPLTFHVDGIRYCHSDAVLTGTVHPQDMITLKQDAEPSEGCRWRWRTDADVSEALWLKHGRIVLIDGRGNSVAH